MAARRAPAAFPDLDDFLCFAVHSTGFAFNRVYRRPLQKLGLTYPQYLVMVALWGEDDVTVGRLGAQVSLDTSTLTPLLKRLEALGLVMRRRSAVDERRVHVALTEQGRALRAKAAEAMACVVAAIGMPEAELRRLTSDIKALRARLDRAAETAPDSRPG